MTFKRTKLSLAMVAALALGACGSDDDTSAPLANAPTPPTVETAKYLVFAVDGEGYVNTYANDGGSQIVPVGTAQQPKNSADGLLTLGEIHFNGAKSRAFIVVQDGFVDGSSNPSGGGVIEIDTTNGEIIRQLNLPSTKTPNISRLVHSYVSPDGKYLWINNDGPSGNTDNDSVFRLNIDPTDTTDSDGDTSFVDDKYLDFVEIVVGNGHKKGAHASGQTNAGADIRPLFVTHNLSARTVSVIDNDPNSPTFLTVIKTVELGSGNTPHGMAFSQYGGHVYTGILSGDNADTALSILDATSPDLTVTRIEAGMGANQIPAAGYVKAFHSHHAEEEGRWIFTAGHKDGKGYLSVVDAQTNQVKSVIDIGDTPTSSFVTTEVEHDGEEHTLVFLGSTGGKTNMAVVHINNETGETVTGATIVQAHVGAGQSHRNGKATDDGEHVFMPNGGDCANPSATPPVTTNGPDCKTIAVYDARTGGVMKIETAGVKPGSMAVLKLRDTAGVSSGPIPHSDGDDHDHDSSTGGSSSGGHTH